jgi:hypothetical protein
MFRTLIYSLFTCLFLAASVLADEAKGTVKSTKGAIVGGKQVINAIVVTIDGKEVEFAVDGKTRIFNGETEVKDPEAKNKLLNTGILSSEVSITYTKGEKKNLATEVKVIKK